MSHEAFSPRHASRPLLTSVFFTVTKALPSHNSDRAKHSLLDGVSSIAAQRGAPIDLGFASITHTVNLNDHSGQSFCSPVNVRTLPSCIHLLWCFLAQLRSEVSYLAKLVQSVSGLPSVPLRLLASELLQWLMSLGFCFVTGSVSRCGFVTSGFATTLEDVPLVHFSQLFQAARPTIHVYHHQKQVTQEKSPVRCNDVFRLNK